MMEVPLQIREQQQSPDENQDNDQSTLLCASAEDITLVKMAKQVEKLEQQIEEMAIKVRNQSTQKTGHSHKK